MNAAVPGTSMSTPSAQLCSSTVSVPPSASSGASTVCSIHALPSGFVTVQTSWAPAGEGPRRSTFSFGLQPSGR